MKNTVFIFCLSVVLISCSKYNEQINVCKKMLLEMNVSQLELDKYQFIVDEAFEKDIYNMIINENNLKFNKWRGFPESQAIFLERTEKFLRLLENAEGNKIFYRVHAIRLIGNDTVNHRIFFLDENKSSIYFMTKK